MVRNPWALPLLLVGCGGASATGMGARFVLEKPIADQCVSAGLQGRPQITEGILLVAEGNKQAGIDKIREGAAENEPQDFQDFVAAMRLLGKIPGAGQYVAPINQVLAMVSPPSSRSRVANERRRRRPDAESADARQASAEIYEDLSPEERQPTRKRRTASADQQPPSPDRADPAEDKEKPLVDPRADVSKWEAETVVPLMHNDSRQCALGAPLSPLGESAKGHCVRVSPGPLVITEIHTLPGCTADLFALAGGVSTPRWILYSPAGSAPLNVTEAFLSVRPKEYFVIGATASSEAKIKGDVRCSVTWSGFRP